MKRLTGVRGLYVSETFTDTVRILTGKQEERLIASIHAAAPAWPALAGFRIVDGRLWSAGEIAARAPRALLSGAWSGSPSFVTIRGIMYSVVGTLEGPEAISGPARSIWIPLVSGEATRATESYLVELDGREDGDVHVAADIERWLLTRYGTAANGESPMAVLTFGAAREQVAMIRRAFFIMLLAFCGIPSILAGVGVAAMTRLAIQERIPEIGLRRALGATRQNILDLFVGEALVVAMGATARAVLLSLVGLGVGYMLAWPIAPPLTMVVVALVMPTLICFGFSVPTAVVAAHLTPIEALATR